MPFRIAAHRVLADAEVEVPAARGRRPRSRPRPRTSSVRLVRRPEVGRAAEEPGHVLREHVEHLARGVAPGDALRVGRKDRQVAVPAVRQLAPLHLLDLGGELRDTSRGSAAKSSVPRRARASAPRAPMPGGEVLAHAVGHQELRVLRPAVGALGQPDLLLAERLAVRGGGVLLVRRAVADVAVEDDQRGPALASARKTSSACSMRSRSLASPTRSTFQP